MRSALGSGLDEVKARRAGDAGQRPEDDGLDPREDRGVHTDADAQGDDDNGGEDRHARDGPHRVAEIAARVVDPAHALGPRSSRNARSSRARIATVHVQTIRPAALATMISLTSMGP
jgi:hypothetical protein